jgi:hypothetical protein
MHSAPGAAWPSKIAYSCAGIFAVAAIGTNAIYGFGRGDNLPSSLIWSGVAIAVSAAFTLAWPATMRALNNRDWPAAAMCAVAAVLFGTLSVAGALGAASAGRTTAANVETDTTAARKRAQASYDEAQAELSRLEPSRSVVELVPLVEAAKPQCRVRVDSTGQTKVCAKPSGLLTELGRAQRRAELQDQIERASAGLVTGSVRPADSDAKALAKYLAAVGLEVTPERITDLLILLAVLVLEFGPGACLALALTLSGAPASRPVPLAGVVAGQSGQSELRPAGFVTVPAMPVSVRPAGPSTPTVTVPATPDSVDGGDVLAWLHNHGGRAIGVRPMAEALGRPRSTLSDQLRRLAGHGRITLTPGRRGLVIETAWRPN